MIGSPHDERLEELFRKYAKVDSVDPNQPIFSDGLDMSSFAFTEFIMAVEEAYNVDIPVEQLDESIVTVGQLFTRLRMIITGTA